MKHSLTAHVRRTFFESYEPDIATLCLNWTGDLNDRGYGRINLGAGVWLYAHRVSFEINVGEIPGDLFVLHRCDNRRCVNHDHLFLGTQADNVADMMAKGRYRQGSGGFVQTVLTPEIVADIRTKAEYASTYAARYGCSKRTIYRVWKNQTWKPRPPVLDIETALRNMRKKPLE